MTKQKTNVDSLKEQLKAFEKDVESHLRESNALRKKAIGLLTPALIKEHTEVSPRDLVLAYGRKQEEFSLKKLKEFITARTDAKSTFHPSTRGVPLALLENESLSRDINNSRTVRTATLYRVKGNLLSFQVSGNSQPHYQVRIQLEDWKNVLHNVGNPLLAARIAATGNISFDCSCKHHQFWFRYLATIGGFALIPEEQDFPKIRNPLLTGCCCKHVLKVLRVLKSPGIHAILARDIKKQSETEGYADSVRSRMLTKDELKRASLARGVTSNPREADEALQRFLREATKVTEKEENKEKLQNMKPRQGSSKKKTEGTPVEITGKARENLVKHLKDLPLTARGIGVPIEQLWKMTSEAQNIPVAKLRQIMKEEKEKDEKKKKESAE